MNSDSICYKCGSPSTSREHVPPLCIFPERKDFNGLDYRQNLITVPSCDLHNSKKSKDDEFLLFSIASIVGNNYVGYLHTHTKITRALRRKSKDFLEKQVIKNSKTFILESSNQRKYIVSEGNPDFERLQLCFEHIASGLYFHEFGNVFYGEIKMLFGFINYKEPNTNTLIKFIRERFKLEVKEDNKKGSNPKVFTYQFSPADEYGLIGLKMTFYEGTEIFVSFIANSKQVPYNIAHHFISNGINTVLTLGDKEFLFNKPNESK
jgi:hypothetical protein